MRLWDCGYRFDERQATVSDNSTDGTTPEGATPPETPITPPPPAYGAPASYPGAPAQPGYPAPAGQQPYTPPAQPDYSAQGGYPAQPGYPAQGQQPAYGAPAPYPQAPYGGYPTGPKTNVLAIISMIASIAGFIWILPIIGSLAGAIMGHISLNQLKTSGEKGRGMALAGVIVGWVGLALVIIGIFVIIAFASLAATNGVRYS